MASPSSPSPTTSSVHRLGPPLVRAAVALALVWALGGLALPLWLKPWLERQATQALGRAVTLDAVSLKPWSLEVEVLGLRVAPANSGAEKSATAESPTDETSPLSVRRIYVNAELSSLFRLAPVVDAVRIEHPVLRITHRGEGRHSWQDVVDRLAADPAPADGAPARVALYNLQLLDGEIALSDEPRQRQHTVTGVALSVPFINTLGPPENVRVSPKLAFTLNGGTFDTDAESRPFDASLATDATLKVSGLDLAPYLDLLPRQLPVRPTRALLGAELKVAFVQTPKPSVQISGVVTARDVALTDAHAKPLLQLASARVELADVRPLERVAQLGAVALTEPRLSLTRDTPHNTPVVPTAEFSKNEAPNTYPNSARTQKYQEKTKNNPPETAGWSGGASGVQLTNGRLDWRDALAPDARQRPAEWALTQLQLQTGAVHWPLPADPAQTINWEASAQLSGPTPATHSAALRLTGKALAHTASAEFGVQNLALEQLAPYLQAHLHPTLQGQLGLQGQARWQASTEAGQPDDMAWELERLTLTRPQLRQGNTELASLQTLEVRNARVRPLARTVNLGQVTLTRPVLPIQRDAQGRWMYAAWLKTPAEAPGPATPTTQAAPWKWQLPGLTVTDGRFDWHDGAPAQAVALQASAVQLKIQALSSHGGPPATVTASLRAGTGQAEPGTLGWQGTLGLGDDGQAHARGRLSAHRLPAQALAPYAADSLNLHLQRADTSFSGDVAFSTGAQGPTLTLQGDATLEAFRAHVPADTHAPPSEGNTELLRWKTLNLQGLNVALAPGTAPQVGVGSGALSDFFARIAIGADGRINLQNIVRAPTAPAVQAAPPHTDLKARVHVGPFSLVNGAVDFSDQFIRPNYQAQLSDLTGRLSGFSSEGATPPKGAPANPPMATLELRGKAEGSASIEINGQLNPLATPLALDIEGRVRNLALPPLSPYAIKYTGHGIERGKLSLDVAYTVQPDGRLSARNQLTLNQLTFGDAVAGAPTSLPVKLAVALLADRQGVIDLNLPISGSLNDPEFSLLPLVFKAIGNIVVKAITAPFALLTGALSGNDNGPGTVAFVPGTHRLDASGTDKLAQVARALADKPDLTLTVVGMASLEAERTAYQREQLQARLQTEQARGAPTQPAAEMTGAERTRWLSALYRRTDMPKPRNPLGLAKDLAPADMEALLLAQIPTTDAQMQTLASQRGEAVRRELLRLQVPAHRVQVGPNHTHPQDDSPTWQPTAELTLGL